MLKEDRESTCVHACARPRTHFLPCLCGKQLVVVGGALVVILSVSDDCGKTFTDQSLRYVTGERVFLV